MKMPILFLKEEATCKKNGDILWSDSYTVCKQLLLELEANADDTKQVKSPAQTCQAKSHRARERTGGVSAELAWQLLPAIPPSRVHLNPVVLLDPTQ